MFRGGPKPAGTTTVIHEGSENCENASSRFFTADIPESPLVGEGELLAHMLVSPTMRANL